MTRRKQEEQEMYESPVVPEQVESAPIAEALPEQPEALDVPPEPAKARPPQGLVPRYLPTSHKKAYHHRWQSVRMIDPASLGPAPFLALPIDGDPMRRRIRHFLPEVAAALLSVNSDTGNPPTIRLATDAEVAQYEADQKKRADERQSRVDLKIDQVREALLR